MKNHFESSYSLHEAFSQNILSAEEIASMFLKRVETRNQSIGAFLHIDEGDVMQQARLIDQKRIQGRKMGRLAGIPVALKDNIAQKGAPLTCASKILENFRSPYDATVVDLIRKEDGIVFGKTNLDEFAMGSSCENSALQKTVNPFNMELTPGGSSGGSAAAVCAGMTPFSLGSDTGGSIRLPASFCGVTGFKPTYGRVSRFGLVAFGSSLDQIGPFARSAKEIDQIMHVIGRHCDRDSTSLPGCNYDSSVGFRHIDRLRVGVPWKFLDGLHSDVRAIFMNCLSVFEKSYNATFHEIDLDLLKYSVAVYYILATAELSTNLARFDGVRYGMRSSKAKTLEELYEMSREEGFGPEVKRRILLGTFVLSTGYQDAYYKKAQKVRRLIRNQFDRAYQSVDAIIMPVSTGGAFPFGSRKDPISMYLEDIYTIGPNLAGLPAISIPSGVLSDDRPVGMQIIGPQKSDEFVVYLGQLFQEKTNYHRITPPCCKDDEK